DTATHTLQSTTFVGGFPHGIVITRDGAHAFVTVPAQLVLINGVGAPTPTRYVQFVDLAAHTVTASLLLPNPPSGIALSADGTRVGVTVPAFGALVEFDASSGSATAQYTAGTNPTGLAFLPAPATAVAYGVPCPAPTGQVTLGATTLPWLGTS